MTTRRKRNVAVEPQRPVVTLANVKAIVGNGFDLPGQFIAAMFNVAPHMAVGTDDLLVRASLQLAWDYQRTVRRIVQPWKRSWNWGPDDRQSLAREIIARVWKSNEVFIRTEAAVEARLVEISVQYNVEISAELFANDLMVIGSNRVVTSINTCRIIWDGIILRPERQKMWL
ncbi:hypothetical protein J4558_01565 [Leptolyngbya sp. 15MV]|nr:hypothetical protein J4558_01565 [Leptolyngbya sp. 15MV]